MHGTLNVEPKQKGENCGIMKPSICLQGIRSKLLTRGIGC